MLQVRTANDGTVKRRGILHVLRINDARKRQFVAGRFPGIAESSSSSEPTLNRIWKRLNEDYEHPSTSFSSEMIFDFFFF